MSKPTVTIQYMNAWLQEIPMDEMLFISMAKLGLRRVGEEPGQLFNEPATCSASAVQACQVGVREAARGRPHQRPSALAALSGALVIVLTLLIALGAVSNWYNERIAAPAGEVSITELGAVEATQETRIAQSAAEDW
jgi:hypothetical protein